MSPLDALRAEVAIELDALARRLGAAVPRAVTIRVEWDDRHGTIRSVECVEERRRNVVGGAIAKTSRIA